jgi:hypothetical protein
LPAAVSEAPKRLSTQAKPRWKYGPCSVSPTCSHRTRAHRPVNVRALRRPSRGRALHASCKLWGLQCPQQAAPRRSARFGMGHNCAACRGSIPGPATQFRLTVPCGRWEGGRREEYRRPHLALHVLGYDVSDGHDAAAGQPGAKHQAWHRRLQQDHFTLGRRAGASRDGGPSQQ